jgi:hypothetical protein
MDYAMAATRLAELAGAGAAAARCALDGYQLAARLQPADPGVAEGLARAEAAADAASAAT